MFKKSVILALLIAIVGTLFSTSVSASENTTYTYTISVDKEWVRTQDAYMPSEVLFKSFGLTQPSDIFISERQLYVADTGNSRIVVIDLDTKETRVIGEGMLSSPSGIFVSKDKTLYVADSVLKAVVVINPDGSLKLKIERPLNNPLFSSKSVFEPKNVCVTSQGNIFVVGVGAHEGIMQFSPNGEFQGFFAANKRNLTMLERIEELVFTDEQKQKLLNRTSMPIENIDITDCDLICSVTQDSAVTTEWHSGTSKVENRVKLHNMAGVNILATGKNMNDEWNFVDIASGLYDQFYSLSYTGVISEYDSDGNLLFSFGGRSMSSDKNGLFTLATAIDVGDDGFLYVLDKERANVQIFYPTDYANITHKATNILKNGDYKNSETLWKQILNLNGMSRVAHIGYGKSLFHQQNFNEALKEFKIANDKENYSNAFWEIRNQFITNWLPYVLIAIIILYVLIKLRKYIFNKNKRKQEINKKYKCKLIDDLLNIYNVLRHPLDNFYDLKHNLKGSLLSSTIIYILILLIFIADMLFRGYLFAPENLNNISIIPVISMLLAPLTLWILGNAMVASINEGEGSLKNVYIITAYSMSPYIVITPIVVILSYGVTYNESFIFQIVWFVGVAWSAILLFLGIKFIHNYSVGETIKNILLTMFFMLMAVVAIAIMYVMWNSLVSFITGFFEEVQFRVTN